MLRALRANEVVCLLCDRDLTGDGVEVEFLGERTTLPAGPATLALRSGAPLIAVGCYFRPHGRHEIRILDPIDTERTGRIRDDVTRVTQEPRPPVRGAHPRAARALAPPAAELAQRPLIDHARVPPRFRLR